MKITLMIYIIISTIAIGLASTLLSSNCDDEMQKIKLAYASANYKELYRNLSDAYDHCKEDCKFINYYLLFNLASTSHRYNSLKNEDINKGNLCAAGENTGWQKLYYLRQLDKSPGNKKENVPTANKNGFDEIYSFALDPHNKLVINDILQNKSGKYLGSIYAAYYLYINELKDEATNMISIPYSHAVQSPSKEQTIFSSGIWQALIGDMMMLEVREFELTRSQIAAIRAMCEEMPYLMKLYNLKKTESYCAKDLR